MPKSTITKRAIAASLKDLLKHMPLEQVTVSAITEQAGINRQTFYYHFHDIHDLLVWIYRDEADRVIGALGSQGDLHAALAALLGSLKANGDFVVSTAHGIDTPYAYRFTYDEVSDFTRSFVENMAHDLDISEDDLKLVTRFYSVGLVETVYGWIADGMYEDPEQLARRIALMLDDSVEKSLRRLSQLHSTGGIEGTM